MANRTKKQRKNQRERKAAERYQRRAKKASVKPWAVPKMKMFNMPRIFPDDVPKEKRLEVIRAIGSQAKSRFEESYPKIADWFADYDAIYLLSFCATYFMSHPEGIDPEAVGELTFYHHYLEILQAFALTKERALSVRPLLQDSERLKKEMEEIGKAMSLRWLDFPPDLKTEEELNSYHLRIDMMSQTTAVRNWAYFHQIKRICLSLANLLQGEFRSVYNVDAAEMIELLFSLMDERSDLLNEHRDKMRSVINLKGHREIIRAYNEAFSENKRLNDLEADEMWEQSAKDRQNLFGMLFLHSDLKLEDIYSFTLDHARTHLKTDVPEQVLAQFLDRLSFKFGELAEFNQEHFILSNPVLLRPFIKTSDGKYFSAVWGVFPHVMLDIFEGLVWSDKTLREKYTDLKAAFLESEIERLFRIGFPSGEIFTGSQWLDTTTGQLFENDLLLVIDNFAIVVEAKSGGVSDPAKRGAPKRLFETLRHLIEEPSTQALRFIEFLSAKREIHSFKTKRGIINTIDSRKIKYFLPLGVTFSQLGMIGSNLKKLIEAKVVEKKLEELAPSISFTDLEIIFDLLPLEVEKIHYMVRRREFEAHMGYQGDEMDLLAFYLDNGFNIGETEYERNVVLNMSMKSKELDPYFVGTSEGKILPKPQLAITDWWRDILEVISQRKIEGWAETGFILLNSTKEDQKKFFKKIKELVSRIKSGRVEAKHNWVMFESGPEQRRYSIAGYPYATDDKQLRNEIMGEILSDENTGKSRGAVVIGLQIERPDYPYSVLARRANTELFDVLTI